MPVYCSIHPVVQHKLSELRRIETRPHAFRELVRQLSWLLVYEALAGLRLRPWQIETPLAPMTGSRIADQIGLVPILRAGLSMAEGVLELLPEAQVWHLGMERDHATRQPLAYYNRLPRPPTMDIALILDPMLATGGSALAAVQLLRESGIERISFIGLVAAPEGLARLGESYPGIPLHIAAIDDHLDEHAYIVPGLGDAGDRQFFTPP